MDARVERVLDDLAPGELVAVALEPGPAWGPLVTGLWARGIPFLPLDHRLAPPERTALIDRARPTALLEPDGELTVFAQPAPIAPGIGVVVGTSGTGGTPKLVELTRNAVAAAVEGSRRALEAADDDPWVACLSPAHVGGLLVFLRSALLGGPVTVLERFDEVRLVEAIAAAPGASVALVPTMLRRLVDADTDLSRCGVLLLGGGPVPGELRAAAEAHGARIVSTYGLTESCGGVVYDGVPFEGTELRIGDDDRIELRGPTIMEGYRHDPAATGATFTTTGWFLTADAGSLDGEGRLHVSGRLDEAIRTGAETVWPDEVERALQQHPKVADVAIAGRPHPEWGQQVVAYVVPAKPDDPPSLDELRDHASEQIARHKAPRELVLVPDLPRTSSGKIRRAELR
ncbi:MAG: class I adenylate-forming enzyme family protein [Actinomycetota bacterium]